MYKPSMPTKHKADCNMAFGRKDMTCPRCIELANGAKPIVWGGFKRKQNDAQRSKEIRAHDCINARCGSVCTFGDW